MIDALPRDEVVTIAQNLARTCGWHLFPCHQDKRPACLHGFKDAVAEPNAIAALWRRSAGPLIGVATGAISGFDCLDLDIKHATARAWWKSNHARVPATQTFRTRSGGLHLYFTHAAGLTCSAGKISAGIDIRADGGYVISWSSADFPCLDDSPLATWPAWLLDAVTRKPMPRPAARLIPPHRVGRSIDGILRVVATAREGQRNGSLYWGACRFGEMVAAGHLGVGEAEVLLVAAALEAGLSTREAQLTAGSGLGRTHDRQR